MCKYDEIKKQVGLTEWLENNPKPKEIVVFAVNDSGTNHEFTTSIAVENFCASRGLDHSTVNHRIANIADIEKWATAMNDLLDKAGIAWMERVRSEFNHLTPKVFDLTFSRAYISGYTRGPDAVFAAMKSEVAHTQSIIDAYLQDSDTK